jgi:MFS family permease
LVFFAAGSMYGTWLSRIVDIQRVLGISPAMLGVALVGSGIGSLAGNALAAVLHRRVDSRTTTRFVGPPFAASLALIGLAPNAGTLFFALFLCGLTYGLLNVAINLQGTAIEHAEGRPALPLLHGLFSIGALTGAAGGVAMASLAVLPRVHFLVVSILILLAGLVAWPALLPDARPQPDPGSDAAPRRDHRPWGLAALALAAVIAHGTVGDWGAVHLARDLGVGSGLAATAPFFLLAAMGLGQLAANDLVRRLGTRMLLRCSAVLATLGLLALALAPDVGVALAGIAVAGLGMACVVPVVTSAAAEGTDGSGSGVTLVISVVSTTDLLGPAVVGFVAASVGLGPVFLFLALPMLVVGLAAGSVRTADWAAPAIQPIVEASAPRRQGDSVEGLRR